MALAPGGRDPCMIFAPGGGAPLISFAPGGGCAITFMPGGGDPLTLRTMGETAPGRGGLTASEPLAMTRIASPGGGPWMTFAPGGGGPLIIVPGGNLPGSTPGGGGTAFGPTAKFDGDGMPWELSSPPCSLLAASLELLCPFRCGRRMFFGFMC